ncbi:LysR substrate-binding domain-containing protein [Mesorhizobium sp. B2-3-11]|uniref:LysR substrate-binding domain-containing protein n=1 Tax=Mesorhizobium sp. B2-3-11 TaxID=2589953 RepID=UPI001FEE3159|nr:LysR substrate-binding domain-containing protein [Mesorhizobium sp. B2-3-11]
MPKLAEWAAKAARRASRGETGSIRVGFIPSAAFNAVVPTAVRTFGRAYPDVEVTLQEANTNGLVAGLQDGSLDAAFLKPNVPESRRSISTFFPRSQCSLRYLPATLPPLSKRSTSTLSKETFLLMPRWFGPTFYDSIIGACRKAGFEPVIGEVAPVIGSVVVLVAAELGVSIVPASMSRLQVAGIAYRPIRGWRPDRRSSSGASAPGDIAGRAQFRRANTRMSRIPRVEYLSTRGNATGRALPDVLELGAAGDLKS